jgi:hypothetical protein
MKRGELAFDVGAVVVLQLVLAAVTLTLVTVRQSTLASLEHSGPQAAWDEYRDAVRAGKADQGFVRRRAPVSDEPPTLVLLRDHFAVCLVGLLTMSGLLYGALIFLIRGVLQSPAGGRIRHL